jgi:hypothetical protein
MRSADAKHLFGMLKFPSRLVLRLLRGPFTLGEIAASLHVRTQNVSLWENSASRPTPGHLRDLLRHYLTWTTELRLPTWDILIAASMTARKGKPWPRSKSTKEQTRS